MTNKQILITDDCHPKLIETFESWGFHCDFIPDITPEQTYEKIANYQGLIINSKILVNRAFIDKATSLRFVGRLGAGMEIVDQIYAKERGILVVSSPEGNRNAVAEQALGMLLVLANNLLKADREVRAKIWKREENRGWELMGKTMGIIGFGHTGSQFAKKLAGLEMNILAYDKYKTNYTENFPFVKESSMQEILENADIISLHLPLTDETKHLVNTDFLEKTKNGVVILNTSRGKCVKTDDLIIALKNGTVRGACLDVFENEKTPTFTKEEQEMYDLLYILPNVVLAPHIAGWTHESKLRMAEVLLEKLGNFGDLTTF
jgi:D-3-phosphoglycerate dehydrogenase / 2-oxoglutarate reductase